MGKEMVIRSVSSVSALGNSGTNVPESILTMGTRIERISVGEKTYPVFPLHAEAGKQLEEFLHQHPKYRKVDRTAQLAMLVAETCMQNAPAPDGEWVVNAGSSRGATHLWEEFHAAFTTEKKVPVKSSPLTTLGNISSHINQHLKLNAVEIDHSITCSSGLQALANGYAWLHAGLAQNFLAVATEAPLTGFTIAQMAALGIYTQQEDAYPCKPCWANPTKKNTFALGEAAVAVALTLTEPAEGEVVIAGMGTASEITPTPTSISPQGDAFRSSMEKAIRRAGIQKQEINLIIPHSPGTYQGDQAEFHAIQSLFGVHIPYVFNHKFLTGHTLGASGLLSVELGWWMLRHTLQPEFPYDSLYTGSPSANPVYVLVNSMGFGGNAVSILLKKI